jgi:HEAT repeat protein
MASAITPMEERQSFLSSWRFLTALVAVAALSSCRSDVPENLARLNAAAERIRANPRNQEARAFIISKLDDHRKITRNNAAAELRLLAEDPKVRPVIAADAIPALIRIAEKTGDVESEAVAALGNFGEYAAPAVPSLIKWLREKDKDVHTPPQWSWWRAADAAKALGKIGPASASAVPDLTKLLDAIDPESEASKPHYLAEAAADALGNLGGHAISAVPALRRQLRSASPSMRIHSAVALRRILPQDNEAIDVLVAFVRDNDATIRFQAINALRDLGVKAPPAR